MKFLGIFVRIFIFFLVKIFFAEAKPKDCIVDTRTGMNQNAPLVSFSTNPPVYIDPQTQATLVFKTKKNIDVACPVPGSSEVQKNRVLIHNKHIILSKLIKCEKGVFKYDGNDIKYQDISCDTAPDCLVHVKTGMNNKKPPLVLSWTNPPEYLYPPTDNPGNFVFKTGSTVDVLCPGQTNSKSTEVLKEGVVLVEDQPLDTTKPIKCVNGLFEYDGNIIKFEDISCHEDNGCYNAIQTETGKTCNKGNNHMYEIGYDFKSKGFLKTLELCHDKNKAKTLWARDFIVPVNQQDYRYSGPGKSFKVGSLYDGIKMSEIYKLENAFKNAVKILGTAKATQYFSRTTSDARYLAKGHLIANADKFLKSEQDSTYFFANAVPMWQKINANPGNWFIVEEYVRYLAFKKGHELDIYVGGIGTLQLENKEIDLYLPEDGSDKMVPVPNVLFKCVLDHQSEEGICFLVVNNPYIPRQVIETSGNDYIVCNRYLDCNTYLPDYHMAERGYLYCCTLKDFHDATHNELGLVDIEVNTDYKEMTLILK